MNAPGSLRLLVPCFRESGRITQFLPALCEHLEAEGDCVIQVVEDGSEKAEQQRMAEIITGLGGAHPSLGPPLFLPRNLGKGGAVYAGWRMDRDSEWLGFVDADGSVPPREVARLVRLARQRGVAEGGIFASRVMMLGRSVHRHLHRHLLGRVYATLVSTALRLPVYDSQCGFKIVPRIAFENIAPLLTVTGFAFDVQLLVALLDSGCPIREEPIDWREIPGGKVRLLRDSWRMMRDVLLIRRHRMSPAWMRQINPHD